MSSDFSICSCYAVVDSTISHLQCGVYIGMFDLNSKSTEIGHMVCSVWGKHCHV